MNLMADTLKRSSAYLSQTAAKSEGALAAMLALGKTLEGLHEEVQWDSKMKLN